MVAPFDAAWSMLKALPGQQIATTGASDEELARLGEFESGLRALVSERGQANPTTGTMHPAIQGMLARRGIAPSAAYPRTESSTYRYDGGGSAFDSPQGGVRGLLDSVQRRRGSVFNPNESQMDLSDRMRQQARSQSYYAGETGYPGMENPPYVGLAMPDRQYPAQQ